MSRSERPPESFDGILVPGRKPPLVPDRLSRKMQGRRQARRLAKRGVPVLRLEYGHREPLDVVKKRGKMALVKIVNAKTPEWKAENPGWKPVGIGHSAGVSIVEHIVSDFNSDPDIEVKAGAIGIQGRRHKGPYDKGDPDSLEVRAGGAAAFPEAVVTPSGLSDDDLQLIGTPGGDSIVKRRDMWGRNAQGKPAEMPPDAVAIEGLKHAWGGLDHVVAINRGYDEIGKDAAGQVVAGRQHHHPIS